MIEYDDNKNQIGRSFSKAAASYDQNCPVQQKVAEILLERLKQFQFSTDCIVDMGCGTGIHTEKIAQLYPYRDFIAIDIAEKFIEESKIKLEPYNIKVQLADFEKKSF